MSRYVDIEPLENALKAVEKRGEVAVLLDELISVIAKYPTADVAEVRHGRWEETTTLNLWECSVCGQMIYSETVLDRKTFHKWCGKCGAKMDEVNEDEQIHRCRRN